MDVDWMTMNSGLSKAAVHILIQGTVQGIGYRCFALRQAKALGIMGWVKNLANGDVELEAQGDKKSLEDFIESLKTGHPWASVQQAKISRLEGNKQYDQFVIKA
ncbi:MAG: acylphosphatase [Elusimicrobiota bacterium]